MRWIALVTLAVASMGGCGDDRDDEIYVHRVDRGHVCTRNCNAHYYDRGGKLVVIKGHRHGPNCGHRWNDGRWVVIGAGGGRPIARPVRPVARPVVVRPPVAGRPHVCGRGCVNHFYNGKRVVALKGHRHGANCGHRWDGRHWVVAARTPTKRVIRRR